MSQTPARLKRAGVCQLGSKWNGLGRYLFLPTGRGIVVTWFAGAQIT
jgi:hypothetical protein